MRSVSKIETFLDVGKVGALIDIAERKIEHVSFEVGCQCVQKVATAEFARRTRPFERSPAGFGIGLDDVQLWKIVEGWRFRDLTEIRLAVSRLRRRCTCRGLLNLQSERGLLSLLLSDGTWERVFLWHGAGGLDFDQPKSRTIKAFGNLLQTSISTGSLNSG